MNTTTDIAVKTNSVNISVKLDKIEKRNVNLEKWGGG
jgi:hypothetical protein